MEGGRGRQREGGREGGMKHLKLLKAFQNSDVNTSGIFGNQNFKCFIPYVKTQRIRSIIDLIINVFKSRVFVVKCDVII